MHDFSKFIAMNHFRYQILHRVLIFIAKWRKECHKLLLEVPVTMLWPKILSSEPKGLIRCASERAVPHPIAESAHESVSYDFHVI